MTFEFTLYDALLSIDVPAEKARAVIDALEHDMVSTLAMKQDIAALALATKQDIAALASCDQAGHCGSLCCDEAGHCGSRCHDQAGLPAAQTGTGASDRTSAVVDDDTAGIDTGGCDGPAFCCVEADLTNQCSL